jgi:hypothetical protein
VTTTTFDTNIDRKLTVTTGGWGADLHVVDTSANNAVFSVLRPEEATKLGTALLGDNTTVITDLPEASIETPAFGYRKVVRAGSESRYLDGDPERVMTAVKDLLAIHKVLVEQQAVAAKEAEVAKEAERQKRRDELTKELTDNARTEYQYASDLAQSAIDRIIDLEEAAK